MKLTKKQKALLQKMVDEDEDLVVYGHEVWVGDQRTSRHMWLFFLRNVLISQDSVLPHYYHINHSGKRALAGEEKIYQDANGVLHSTIEEIVFADAKLREKGV
jgi:hypothetical protein